MKNSEYFATYGLLPEHLIVAERAREDAAANGTGEELHALNVGSSRVDLQACKLEYSIVSPK